MRKFFTIAFWDYAIERGFKTAVQAVLAGGLIGGGLFDLDWPEIGSIAGGTVLLSFLTSFLAYRGDGSDDADDLGDSDGAV